MIRERADRERRRGAAAWRTMVLAASVAVIALLAWGAYTWADHSRKPKAPIVQAELPPLTLSAWIVDWQREAGLADFEAIAPGLDGAHAFAAYADAEGRLYFTDASRRALADLIAAAKDTGVQRTLLTVVNDRYGADGKPDIQKDPALLTQWMATASSRGELTEALLAAAEDVDGIELDYERVPDASWDEYVRFIGQLYGRLQAQNKALRVVLEPSAPVDGLDWPIGPEYVIMAYNLYGGFGGPGPKADMSFIAQQAARLADLPGDNAIALALGGFDWIGEGLATAVTEQQAADLASSGGAEPTERDEASGSLHFRYTDTDGIAHTVWYADAQTLSRWIGAARDAGVHKLSLWRLGGLSDEMRTYLRGL